jgi:hypothetical protein
MKGAPIFKKLLRDIPAIVLGVLVEVFLTTALGSQASERPWIQIDLKEVDVFLAPSHPAPAQIKELPEQSDFQIPDTGMVRTRSCTDAEGRQGAFQAMVFLDSYNWAYKSIDRVEFNGQPTDFPAVLRQQPLQQILIQAQQVVAAGTASCEASRYLWGPFMEERRAEQRAQQLVTWIEESRGQAAQHPGASMRNVLALNLGRFQKNCSAGNSASTWNQRRIVLIAVTEKQENLDLESCLERRMKDDDSLKFLTDNYSKFELDRHWRSEP